MAKLLNDMAAAGIITDYALFGAMAQMRYTEPVATLDAGFLVGVHSQEHIDVLSPIYKFCAERGYHPEGEAVRVGEWPVQFIPVFSDLTREAMEKAETADFEGVPLRVVGAVHLAIIALGAGRGKDMARVPALLESGQTPRGKLAALAGRHGLSDAWRKFERRFLDD